VYAQTDYRFSAHAVSLLAYRYEAERGVSHSNSPSFTSDSSVDRRNMSFILETHGEFWNRLFYSLGGGIEKNAVFGVEATPRASLAYYPFQSGSGMFRTTKLNFNFGKGVKEPSIFDESSSLFDLLRQQPGGDQLIQKFGIRPIGAERSRSYDFGVEQGVDFFALSFVRQARDVLQRVERDIMLQIVDAQWKDHLYSLDHLKEGIGLRSYGQRDPLVEYKKESFAMFQALMDRIDEEILRWVFLYQAMAPPEDEGGEGGAPPVPTEALGRGRGPQSAPVAARAAEPRRAREPELALAGARPLPKNLSFNNPGELLSGSRSALGAAEPEEAHGGNDASVETVRREGKKVGRNDPCPCGSGRKYKKCHGA